jgi:Tfp pilus assembly protein PilN
MLNYLKNIELFKSNRVTGLHCIIDGVNNPKFVCIILSRGKGKIEIEDCSEFQCEFENIKEYVSVKYPIYLSLDGRGIIHKRLEADSSGTLLQQAIPNANEDDFIIEVFEGLSQTTYVSLTRKDLVNDILKKLSDQKFSVIGLTISPFTLNGIYEIFPQLPSPLDVNSYELHIDKTTKAILDFRKSDPVDSAHVYQIGEYELSSSQILPFYHALNYYTNGLAGAGIPVVSNQKAEYISKRLFNIFGSAIMGLLFLTLLANMMVFTSISEEKQSLEIQTLGNKEIITKLKHVKDELALKEKFLGRTGSDSKKWHSSLADQIGASMPEEITMEKLDFQPINSKIINFKEIKFESNIIRIEAVASDSRSVNNWAVTLKKIPGISNVIVESYYQLENSALGKFIIEINIMNSNN